MIVLDEVLPFLMVWQKQHTSKFIDLNTWDDLAILLQVADLEDDDLYNSNFRRRHRITLGFRSPASTAPFYELDIVLLREGNPAFVWCKAPDSFVAIDQNGQEHPWRDVDDRIAIGHYYIEEKRFERLFPDVCI